MEKVLYVFPKLETKQSGGTIGHKRSFDCLCNYYGENNVISMPISREGSHNLISMFVNDIVSFGFGGMSSKYKKKIIDLVRKKNIELVYIDSSLFGVLAKGIKKKTKAKTIVFFHNVEYDFWKRQIQLNRKYFHSYRIPLAFINEKCATKYAHTIIALNNKDSERIRELYGRTADFITPVAIKSVDIEDEPSLNYSEPLKLLFFGSNFPPNLEAAEILIKKIMPYVDARLVIAGNGMDCLSDKCTSRNIEVRGFVDNLYELYNSCDVVVMPIISGAGMKIKTAESLMYGKNIIATTNALEGYDVDGVKGIFRCDTPESFIETINTYDRNIPRFNTTARELFESKYSYKSTIDAFSGIFASLTV